MSLPPPLPKRQILGLLILCTIGCSDAIVDQTDTKWSCPRDAGPWSVGTRQDVITGTDGENLVIQSWYPSNTSEGTAHAYGNMFTSDRALSTTVPDCSASRPVLAFSHGSSAINYQSYFLTEHLASHGWVIVAPDHHGNTLWDDVEHRISLALRRPIDIQDTVDWLFDTLAGPGGVLDGCVEPEAGYAISGHSFGGYTTLASAGATIDLDAALNFCENANEWLCGEVKNWAASEHVMGRHDLGDERIWAAVPMAHAGYEILYTGLDEITVPILVLGGGLDPGTTIESQIQPTYDGLLSAQPAYLGEIEQAGHFAFSNACDMLSGNVGPECSDEYIEPAVAHDIIRTWTTAFLQEAQGRKDAELYMPGGFSGIRWEAN